MKSCPVCDTGYPDQHITCPEDGAVLIESREFAPGAVVRNKYRITRKLGQGGMGTVYLAEHMMLGGQVALKFLAVELSRDPRFIRRFRMEARAAYQLRHPNIVEVTDLDQGEDGSLFIAMEYIDGMSLRGLIHSHPSGMPAERALGIARGIALGMGAAHARGMVHRDIKPENILIAQGDLPKVLDFGIVAMAEGVTGMSRTHGLMLTPEYAAPEQWRGVPAAELDGRTDLYALGGVLCEMLTGRTAFHAHNTEGWMYQHLHEEPRPPGRVLPKLAEWPGLDALVLRLLARERSERPVHVDAFLMELDRVRTQQTPVGFEDRETMVVEVAPERAKILVVPAPPAFLFGQSMSDSEPAEQEASGSLWDEAPKQEVSRWRKLLYPVLFTSVLLAGLALYFVLTPHPRAHDDGISSETAHPAPTSSEPPTAGVAAAGGQAQSPGRAQMVRGNAATPTSPPTIGTTDDVHQMRELFSAAMSSYQRQNYQHAFPEFVKACAADSTEGCFYVGYLYETGKGAGQSYSRAADIYRKACEGDEAAACARLGQLYLAGDGVGRDAEMAKRLLQKSCGMGDQLGCDGMKALTQPPASQASVVSGTPASPQPQTAAPHQQLQPQVQPPAPSAKQGVATNPQPQNSVTTSQSCTGGELKACDDDGDYFLVRNEPSKAEAMYKTACDGGFLKGCQDLGSFYYQGDSHSAPKGVPPLNKACDGGLAYSCRLLAGLYWSGFAGGRNVGEAKRLYQKACSMGDQPSCDILKTLN